MEIDFGPLTHETAGPTNCHSPLTNCWKPSAGSVPHGVTNTGAPLMFSRVISASVFASEFAVSHPPTKQAPGAATVIDNPSAGIGDVGVVRPDEHAQSVAIAPSAMDERRCITAAE
jgi:hypothetical protein